MVDTDIPNSKKTTDKAALARAGLFICAVLAAGLWLIWEFAEAQAERDLANWQARMSLIADSRAAEASSWLNRHLDVVEQLSTDASVQLYSSGAMAGDDPNITEAQRGYIYNLLSAEAERSGFHEKTAIDTVAANVKRPQRAGLAIVTENGNVMVASSGMPALRPDEWSFGASNSYIAVGPALEDKTPLVLFGALISPASNNDGDTAPATWLVGARPLDGDFHQTLIQPGDQSESAETYIILPSENTLVTPLTPLREGGRIGKARDDKAAAFAANQPNGFGSFTNYAGTEVLVTGKELSAPVPWILVRTITTDEALAAINERRNTLITTLSLAVLFILAAVVLAWRDGVSRKLAVSYRHQAALSEQKESLYRFVQSVSDGQRNAIAALDTDMTVRFTNHEMARITGIGCADLMNRKLDNAFANNLATLMREKVLLATKGTKSLARVTHAVNGIEITYQLEVLPLKAGGNQQASALLVMQDISDLIEAQERSEKLFKQLISTLTQIIDARDPWSKHHSVRVAEVAEAIAEEMGLDKEQKESITIAGQLVNLGKIFVPVEILTKETPLTDEEFKLVRESMQKAAALVTGLEFKGPVAENLAQMHEHWDGSGEPKGMAGTNIEAGARILTLANAFVGMVSARAHRESFGFDKAADLLQQDAGIKFERRAVAALQSVLENKGGRDKWKHFMEKPAE